MNKDRERQLDSAYCTLHNTANDLLGNSAPDDLEWFASLLFRYTSHFGAGDVATVPWMIENNDFARAGLTCSRTWTNKPRWDALTTAERDGWRRLAFACLHAMPHLFNRIGHRYEAWAAALGGELKAERRKRTGDAKACTPNCSKQSNDSWPWDARPTSTKPAPQSRRPMNFSCVMA